VALADSSGKQPLDETVIVASRYEKEVEVVNAAVSQFDGDDIRTIQPRTFEDIFRYEPGVEVVGGPRQTAQEVQIRGEGGNAVTVRIDGARQNFVSGHSGQRFFLDPELVRIGEILRGAGSSLYGSGGAGVIALDTWRASDFLGSDAGIELSSEKSGKADVSAGNSFDWGGRVKVGYASGNDEMVYSGTGAVGEGPWDFLVSFVHRDSGDVRLGNGEDLAGSGIRVNNGIVKAGYNVDENQRVELSYAYYESNDSNGANPQQISIDDFTNTLVDRDIENQQARLAWNWNPEYNDWVDLSTTLYWKYTEHVRNYIPSDSTTSNADRENTFELQPLGIDFVNRSQYEAFGAKQNLITGFEFYNDDQTGDESRADFVGGGGTGSSSGRPDAESNNFGFFVQNDASWDNGLSGAIGVRYDYMDSSSENGRDQSDDQFSPNVELRYEALEGLGLFGSYAHAFTAPTLNEIYNSGSHFGNVPTAFHPMFGFPTSFYEEVWVPNEDLSAATSQNIEFGIDYNKEIADGTFAARVSWFQKNGEETIDYETIGSMTVDVPIYGPTLPPAAFTTNQIQAQNRDETKIEGWEATVDYIADQWYVRSSLSIIDGEDETTGEKLNSTPGDKVTLELGYSVLEDLTVGGRALWVAGREDKVSDENAKTSGYDIYGIFADWRATDNLILTAGVHNLLDQEYEVTSIHNTQAGRSYYLSANFIF
jgi:hemoglobin/transferrin/lactoferrin receptor protein